jgi:hypothetical protein
MNNPKLTEYKVEVLLTFRLPAKTRKEAELKAMKQVDVAHDVSVEVVTAGKNDE